MHFRDHVYIAFYHSYNEWNMQLNFGHLFQIHSVYGHVHMRVYMYEIEDDYILKYAIITEGESVLMLIFVIVTDCPIRLFPLLCMHDKCVHDMYEGYKYSVSAILGVYYISLNEEFYFYLTNNFINDMTRH